ncbi:MAG: peptide-methionine (R)-S-oxide reductase MsrB [Vicinamibacteria bacterium]
MADANKKLELTPEEWAAKLTPEQFHVAREKGTERAFTGAYWDNKDKGMYRCIGCNEPLFDSNDKFDSGTGWPSFTKPAEGDNVETETDRKFLMTRTEVHCSKCGTHLGHLFPDGPKAQGGMRYCINSASLQFDAATKK